MRRVFVGVFAATAVLVAAVAVYVGATLPPRATRIAGSLPGTHLLGAYHVHSRRSDGTGTVDQIAEAAARAGLAFVILTDHGDGTRLPDAPAYRHGVLCIDASEINSFGGHVVALNVGRASVYPLAGETRDVIEDIHRLGGWAVAAHPDSPRANLRWPPDPSGVDGIEWLNADSEWRRLDLPALLGAGARALARPAETLAGMFERPERSLRRWDGALRSRPVFSLAALDVHARLGFDDDQAVPRSVEIPRPRYEDLFLALAQVVVVEGLPTKDAIADAGAVLSAIGAGRSYSVVRGFAEPAALLFEAVRDGEAIRMGASVPTSPQAVVLRAAVTNAQDSRVVLLRDGRAVAEGRGQVEYDGGVAPGAYRVEVYRGDHRAPWVISNAIRIGNGATPTSGPTETDDQAPLARLPIAADAWSVERDRTSTASVSAAGGRLQWEYALGGGVPAGQYVALATPARADLALDRIEFTASASVPMRLSVQIRLPGGVNGHRWRRSVYVGQEPRRISVRVSDLDPVESSSVLRPIRARVQSVLLVVDTVNAFPGTAGRVTLSDVTLVGDGGGPSGDRRLPSGSH